MKVSQETIRKVTVTEIQGLDPLAIYLEDIGPGKGKITITCYDQSWTSYWGGMSDRTISEFVRSCDNHYLAKNLSKVPSEINDPDGLHKDMLKKVLTMRRADELNAEDARRLFNDIRESDWADEDIMDRRDLLSFCYGDEWWCHLPKKPNPEYEYLCRIITAVKEALKEIA